MHQFIQGRMFSLSLVFQVWSDHLSPPDVIALKGGYPCHYCSFCEWVSAPFHLSSYLWDLDYGQNVHHSLLLLHGGAFHLVPSSVEGQDPAVACDQGEELDLCDLEDDYVAVEAHQTAHLVRGEVAGDVELEVVAAVVVQLVYSFSDQPVRDVWAAAADQEDLQQKMNKDGCIIKGWQLFN